MNQNSIRTTGWAVVFALVLTSCGTDQPRRSPASPDVIRRIAAANTLTRQYARSRLSEWNVGAIAAGTDCRVLLVHTSMVLDDAIVEALHYGTGRYDVYEGGVQHFYLERKFRGVAYKDASGRVWTYGAVSPVEADSLPICH